MNIIFIGAGNLATRLSLEMRRVGMTIRQVYSRTEENAYALATKLHCDWTTSIENVYSDADLYVFSVKDDALEDVLRTMKPNDGLWVHMAGSVTLDIFKPYTRRYGVFYPLQTFSKGRSVAFDTIPVFLETALEEDKDLLYKVASALTGEVRFLSSEDRKQLHLAAVFACNFTNHCYSIAAKMLKNRDIPYNVLLPLIDETAAKIHEMSPALAQTGPAIRYDEKVIGKQLDMLKETELKEIYLLMSQHIYKEARNE